METSSSQTKSVERPVRAVDLFIASLDALTSLQGSSTLSAWIDSDERCWLFRLAGLSWRKKKKKGQRDARRAVTRGMKSRDYWSAKRPKDAFLTELREEHQEEEKGRQEQIECKKG